MRDKCVFVSEVVVLLAPPSDPTLRRAVTIP